MKTFHLALLLFSFPFLVFAAPNWPNQYPEKLVPNLYEGGHN